MNEIQQLDNQLITAINFDGSNGYDDFWWTYTNGLTWALLAAVAVFYIVWYNRTDRKQLLLTVLAFAVMFTLCDQIPSSVIKPLVARFRPSHNPDIMDQLSFVNGYTGGRFGFPSNHACNGFGVAMFLTLLFRNRIVSIAAFLWAIGSCYSRMYLGVHYPTDILVGAILGICFALLVYYIYNKVGGKPEAYRNRNPWAIPAAFLLTIFAILCHSSFLV